MSDDGEVLRFRPRGFVEVPPHGGWSEPPDPAGLGPRSSCATAACCESRCRHHWRRSRHRTSSSWRGWPASSGGDDELEHLGTDPLEPEELRLDGIRHDLRERVAGIDERLARWSPPLLGDEGLSAARRLLTRAVTAEPGLVTRSDRDDLAAGAVLWAVAKGNDLIGSNRPLRAAVIQEVCGLRSTPSQRGSSFAHAVGGDGAVYYGRPLWMFDAQPAVIPLGSPDLLLSRFRRRLVLVRDLALGLRARTPTP